ncbi:hypothetical protein Rvan_2208 [Rhodomicrobium vannielii ATCC 17100]|uniref:DUF3775 domain-containing protein n=1 Tax=Rhodomicrobium vannielii (strain ATCC 17100 / DSM 162 / LMG 4299 / NCIMB 10020 / ATH 3.1.1) TaxID=648757 RepID=E3I372_RHOVT|nr:DUF3775 domain-containing protein [Rhodomicrobium vannielii]ADP71433.1 hypothetical protein Rvan_2208 [Rhodomicrobium vannielii ATCC 17100]
MLEVTTDKVAHVILRARELDVKTAAWDDDADSDDATSDAILEDRPDDATRQELREFLDSLNEDEQASLIALAWIGRGTYAPGELDEAIATAKTEHGNNPVDYLFGLPLLPDYLEDALDQLGYSVEEAEEGIVRRT